MRIARRPLSVHVHLARALVPLLALLLVVGDLLPEASILSSSVAAQPAAVAQSLMMPTAATLAANDPSFTTRVLFFGTGNDATHSVTVGDLNNDAYLDIVAGKYGQPNEAYLNDGAGNFAISRTFGTGTDATEIVTVGDLNGDSALDIVAGNYSAQSVIHLNVPGRSARRKCARHLLAVHEEGARSGDAADHIDVGSGRAEHGTVRTIKRDGPLGIAAEGVNVERKAIVKLAVARAEHGSLARKGSECDTRARCDAETGWQPLVLHPRAKIERDLGAESPMILSENREFEVAAAEGIAIRKVDPFEPPSG